MDVDKVTISSIRLQELLELEKKIPLLVEEAIAEFKKKNLEKLRAHDKANPSAVNARVKRYADKHREEINKKMRERRKLKKEKALLETAVSTMKDCRKKEDIVFQVSEAVDSVMPKSTKKSATKEENSVTALCTKVQNDVIINFSS